ncbi:MAG TPA: hypothetical protein VMD05_04845 [Candidatus Nanoarchaeia archaeon]|nr:hypothetical protein [Candidatus Nanoarchaeia archaeon]
MKRTAIIIALTIFSLAIMLPMSLNLQATNAQTGYSIQHVDQSVQLLESGHVVVSDTFTLTGTLPSSFLVGMPFKYSSYILKGVAYDSNYNVLSLTLGVQFMSQSGFYAASVALPSGTPNTFTVVFIFSNNALTSTPEGYNLDFPAYPSLTQTAGDCNVTIVLPSGMTLNGIDKSDGPVNATNYDTQNLAAFTYSPGTGRVGISTGYVQQVNIPSLNRQIGISASGTITVTDTYRIVDNSSNSIAFFLVNLPLTAQDITARDQFGRVLTLATYQTNSQVYVQNVTLVVPINQGESADLSLDYSLPSVSPAQFSRYVLTIDLLPYFNYYIDSATVTITPPEGATIVAPTISQLGYSGAITRTAFQETVTFYRQGVSFVDSVIPSQDNVAITFDYNPLWIAFRPTSWMWAITAVGLVVVALWMRPKAKPSAAPKTVYRVAPGAVMTPESVNEFVDAYEEKIKITRDMSTLEARAAHGRIPRRRYKVQRIAMEQRLESLAHTIGTLKEILRSAGGSYADLVRQLETAEVESEEVEMTLKNLEINHETGEIGMEAYRKQLADLERRKTKAETRVNELLLRLRAELR